MQRSSHEILGLEAFRRSLMTFCTLCRLHNVEPILITQTNRLVAQPSPVLLVVWKQATKDMGIDYETHRRRYGKFNEAVRVVATEEDVFLIDLAKRIPQDSQHIDDFFTTMARDRSLLGTSLSPSCIHGWRLCGN